MTGPWKFRFLNVEQTLTSAADWNRPDWPKLWLYNLHYFDDISGERAAERVKWHRALIVRWIEENEPPRGNGWESYPISLRLVNWIKWILSGNEPVQGMLDSMATQARMLRLRLEYKSLGNHLFVNAKALVFAGLFFEGHEAARWLDKGLRILATEIPEQILPDGGHFERSPMYHALALEDVIDLINIANVFPGVTPGKWQAQLGSWPSIAIRMRAWLGAMCHPDREIAFFNDAAIGIAPSPAALEHYAKEVIGATEPALTDSARTPDIQHEKVRVQQLSQSGYARADAPDAALFLDVAPVGPDYLPGHAHADTLSFELSLFGQRIIVNGGTSRYGLGPERDAERGTPAHSTVTINDVNSSEVWAGFRVARRARPFDLVVVRDPDTLEVSCAHDGYKRLAGQPVHRRRWLFQPGTLRVEDRIEGGFKSAVARFHLHPAVTCEVDDSGLSGILHLQDGQTVQWRASGGGVRVEQSIYCPEFGRREVTQCLAVAFDGAAHTSVQLTW